MMQPNTAQNIRKLNDAQRDRQDALEFLMDRCRERCASSLVGIPIWMKRSVKDFDAANLIISELEEKTDAEK